MKAELDEGELRARGMMHPSVDKVYTNFLELALSKVGLTYWWDARSLSLAFGRCSRPNRHTKSKRRKSKNVLQRSWGSKGRRRSRLTGA